MYGYGFWVRYMSYYPRTVRGDVKEYFVSRVTQNKKYEDASKLGDRKLVIFMGNGFYEFSTYDAETKNVKVVKNINYPQPWESRWAFLYFSMH